MENKETKVPEPEGDVKKEENVVVETPSTEGAPGLDDDPGGYGAGSESTISSGIGTGKSSENNSDTMSVSSGGTVQSVPTSGKVLGLCQRGEWMVLDQHLRTLQKGHADLSQQDEETGQTPLMVVVRENKLVVAERLLDLGAQINERAKDDRTALHFAAAFAKDDVVRLLINRKAEVNLPGGPKSQLPLHMACARASGAVMVVQLLLKASSKDGRLYADKNGAIPLFLAAEAGNVAVCKELLYQHADQQLKMQRKDNGDTVLHISCRRRDLDFAKMLVESGAPVDTMNDEKQTPLHLAAWEGDEAMVKYLYQMKANPNLTDKFDRGPVHIAAERGHTNVVDLLVDKCKASISARTKDGSTLMHIASQYGHPETALAFLRKGVPLHMPNKSGAICLHAAAMKGHTNVVRSLLTKGASVDSKTKDGYTPLHLAVEYCKPQVVQMLLGFGAQVELKGGQAQETPLHIAARTKEGEKCGEMLLKSGANVNASQENGETAMHIAARYGQLKMVIALLEDGGNPTQQSKIGETPLHVAVRHCHLEVTKELLLYVTKHKSRIDAVMLVNQHNWEGETSVHYVAELTKNMAHSEFEDTDITRLLLEYDGDTSTQTKLTHESPLHYSARSGNEDILMEIVKNIKTSVQSAVNTQSKNGWSPLLVASEQGHLQIVKILLQNHARVDVFDEHHGKAALHLAAENGHHLVADVLLWHKAFVNAKSKLGVTPLHLAAQNGFNRLVKLLLETHGATIDALSLAKRTPLHYAAQNGQMEVCSTLLKMKADANATDVHGQTPLHLAAENDHSDVVKLFLKYRPELVTMANTNGMTCAHIAASKGSVAVIKELMRFNKGVVTTAKNRTSESTALHLAAAGGHKEVLHVLLNAGALATEENADGMTVIHLAGKHGHVHILEALKGQVSWRITSKKTGLSALHVAAHFGQVNFVREMLTKVPATVKSEMPGGTGDAALSGFSAEHKALHKWLNLTQLFPEQSGLTPLHLAAQSGHEGLVRLLLNSPGVQADVSTNAQGAIPLHLAAQGGHTAVVSLLLSKSTTQLHLKDKRGRTALHLAAANGHIDMVALLLGQGADINACDKNGWTALHFSAKAGYLTVVKLLVEGAASPKFETKDGKVPICYAAAANHSDVLSYLMRKDHNTQHLMDDKKFVFDLMVCGKMNNNKCIEEFILLSPAPVDTAAKMSKNFRLLAIKEKERSRDLTSAGNYCEFMATELLAIAASANSAGTLLKAVDCHGTQFLDVLIEHEQKEVVSHPAVQKYLSDVWVGNLRWATWKIVMLFMAFLFIPIVWLIFSMPLKHRFNKVPIIKFMAYLVSHLYLMILFSLTVVLPLVPIWQSGSLIPHWYEWLLLAWLSGLLVSELTNPGDRGGLGWIKVISIGLSSIGIFVHVIAFAFDTQNRLLMLYIRNQFFACALLMSFVQLLDFLSFHHLFGPWAIIIRDLLKDLTRFLVILLIFITGFTLHLSAIYQPVYSPVSENSALGTGVGNGEPLTYMTPIDTFELLFFSLFGLVDPDSLPTTYRSPFWVISLAKIVFGIYMMVTLIVLINLLIAMMSDTYQRIQQQSDMEWKFGRAKLIRNMNKTSATPSPLNLFTKLITYCRVAYKHRGKLCNGQSQDYVHEDEDLDNVSDSRSVDLLAHNSVSWLRNVVRRNTQVAPEGGFLRVGGHHGPQRLEDVVDWLLVVKKYMSMQGIEDSDHTITGDDDTDKNGDITGIYKMGAQDNTEKSNRDHKS
ncbi:serine/threonine-protein phosphatase 6 regulatory ankyrin repeat subunit A-like isoform X2 [Pecten maximus]|uniref:serine/threonine-protein phosphatase 6 regulatory ankyrin repeat subunit A-like isoform X2 n=1 Tax=Pecten maximus TaxID=6579 RepID=UPI001458C56F|nr:serine/threonine-protein phosphatase 6 regulatory ankyrin repeat subunit A-like isoform X2 [Pecten maximus]